MWGMSQSMKDGLRREHQVASKVVLLDTNFEPVQGGTLYSVPEDQARRGEIQNRVSDGNIDVDVDRGTRRTAEVTLLNTTSEFTPAVEDFKPDGPWSGLIYLNRLVRIYRGIYVHGSPEYVPVGTFMIDKTNTIVESNMSLVNLTMSDQWKRMSKSYADRQYNFAANSWYNDIIETILNDSGGYHPTKTFPVIDPLDARANDDKKTSKIVTLEEGDSRGDFLKELVKTWDIDMYYDPMGRFRTEDRTSARDKRAVWHFYANDQDPSDTSGMLVSLNREFSDDNLYNHVIVVGGADKNMIRRERADTQASSKTNIALIGDRVWRIEDDKLNTEAKVMKALNRAWALRFQMSEILQGETISNPALEGDDVVRFTDKTWTKVDGEYRLRRFTVPLVTSRQDVQALGTIYEENL